MSRVYGLFERPDGLERARRALEEAGLGGAVEVIEGMTPAPEGGADAPLPGGAVVARAGRTAPTTVDARLGDLDLDADEASYFERSVAEGGSVLLVDSDDAGRVRALLEEHGAERTFVD